MPLAPRASRSLALLLAAMAGTLAAVSWFVQLESHQRLNAQSMELAAVTELKALQLSEWYRERTDDAFGRAADPFLVASVRDWRAGQHPPQLAERLQVALAPRRQPWRYLNVWLLDPDGQRIFDARRNGIAPDVDVRQIAECAVAHAPVFGVIRDLGTSTPFIDICMPVAEMGAAPAPPAGLELYRADASQLVVPTVMFSMRSDPVLITTVLRFEGEQPQVMVSSGTLAGPGQSPVMTPAGFLSPAHRSWNDTDLTGRDGIRRLVTARPVPDTPWTIIGGVSRYQVLRGAYEDAALIALLVVTLGVAGYLAFLQILQRREREAARQTIRLDRLLQVRSAINETIVRVRDRQEMLSRFCELAVSLGRFELAAVYQWVPDSRSAQLVASHGSLPQRLTSADIEVGKAIREGPVRTLFEDGKVAIVPDLRLETPTAWTKAMMAAGTCALVALPIREDGRITGSFWMYSSEAGAFDRRDVRFFNELASDISYGLENITADDRRRETELQLNAAFDAAPFAMFLIGREDSRIIRANAAAIRQYAGNEGTLIGYGADRIFTPDDLAHALPAEAGSEPPPVTATHLRKDGEPFTVEISARTVTVAGRLCDMVVAVDVTERRQLEEQYRQAQRLEAVGKLAGGIAHDFNNLLTVISGFAAMLQEDIGDNPGAQQSAEQIQIAARRASDLTKSLLAFSRRQVLQTKFVHLNEMVRETATMLSRLISEDIVLQLSLDASRDAVNVDPSQMQQVLMNLAVNARDAMKKGGRLTIATRDLAGHLELRVSDTGTGIAADALAHVFEPFFTTKQPGEGTGLGLSTVHGIITQSGGTVTVDTTVGRGSTFVVTLPRADRAAEPAPPQERPAPRRTGKGTIMLVEDDEGVRSLATIVLQRGGYQVTAFPNGAAALAAAASTTDPVDLVLTDVVMPGMSGPELVRRLLTYYPTLPVVYMSGYAEEAAARMEIDAATLDLLNKPFAPQELLKRIDAALGGPAV